MAMATKTAKREPKNIPGPGPDFFKKMRVAPAHAGGIFREFYRQAGTDQEVSQAECARRMGMSTNRLNEIERGKRGVTPETALLFSAVTGTTAQFWMNLQTAHDLWKAWQTMKPQLKKIEPIFGSGKG